MLNRISELWCKKMHSKAMWPIHGRYICPQCFRAYPVAWEDPAVLQNEDAGQRAVQQELGQSITVVN
jgi:uncharacterized protein YbaR (Trm112 family)